MARKTPTTKNPLRLGGALDVQNAAAFQRLLNERLSKPGKALVLDLADVASCDSAGLQLLCAARRSTLLADRRWTLANPSDAVLGALSDTAIKPEQLGL